MRHRATWVVSWAVAMVLGLAPGSMAIAKDKGDRDRDEPAITVGIPADSPMSQLTVGMKDWEVKEIMGEPDNVARYETGKRWIPFYGRWANDARRQTWTYHGQGQIVMSQNKYNRMYSLQRVVYEPGGSSR